MNDNLSIGQKIAKWWDEHEDFTSDKLSEEIDSAFSQAIRENEFLRDTLTIIDMQAMNVMQDDVSPYGAILKCGWVHEKCKEALQRNKDNDND